MGKEQDASWGDTQSPKHLGVLGLRLSRVESVGW
jgi:hypothetical protein